MASTLRSFAIFTIIYSIIFLTTVNAQISISSSDILALKGTSRAAYTSVEETDTIVITPGGINQTWDYRNINTEAFTSAVLEYLDAAGGYRADLFPEANFRQRISSTTDEGSLIFDNYMNVSSNILRTLGSAGNFEGFSIIEVEDDDSGPLPMSYGTSWISVSNDTSEQFGFRTITNDSTWNSVDASGILRLTMGEYECLRLREMSKTITESTFNGVSLGAPDTTFSDSYVWLSKDHLQVLIVDGLEDNMGEIVMTLSGATTSVKESFGSIPLGYTLKQNYPNPFNPSTTISYSLPKDGFVTLSVYDALGSEVVILDNGFRSVGNYSQTFDASDLSSGIYFYTIRSGNFVQTKKMLLMK